MKRLFHLTAALPLIQGYKTPLGVSLTDIDIKTYTHSELRTLYDDPDWWVQKERPSLRLTR